MTESPSWFVVQTRISSEEFVSGALAYKGYEVFVPMYREPSARTRNPPKTRALFPGYVFCRCTGGVAGRVVTTPGVIRLVGYRNVPAAVPEHELENVRRVVEAGIHARPWQEIPVGALIRIEGGPLAGVSGVFLRREGQNRLIVSISLLQRSLLVVFSDETEFRMIARAPDPAARAPWAGRAVAAGGDSSLRR